MAEKFIVTGNQRDDIDGQMLDIKRQLRLKNGSPLNPELVKSALQSIVEGVFTGISRKSTNYFSGVLYRNDISVSPGSFRVGLIFTKNNAEVKFSSVDPKFVKLFGNKTENNNLPPEGFNFRAIYARRLLQVRSTQIILRELGSSDAIFTLENIYEIIKGYRRRDWLSSSVDGEKNFFYALDVNNEIQSLCLQWDNGWVVQVSSDLKSNKKIYPPARVFSFRS